PLFPYTTLFRSFLAVFGVRENQVDAAPLGFSERDFREGGAPVAFGAELREADRQRFAVVILSERGCVAEHHHQRKEQGQPPQKTCWPHQALPPCKSHYFVAVSRCSIVALVGRGARKLVQAGQ